VHRDVLADRVVATLEFDAVTRPGRRREGIAPVAPVSQCA